MSFLMTSGRIVITPVCRSAPSVTDVSASCASMNLSMAVARTCWRAGERAGCVGGSGFGFGRGCLENCERAAGLDWATGRSERELCLCCATRGCWTQQPQQQQPGRRRCGCAHEGGAAAVAGRRAKGCCVPRAGVGCRTAAGVNVWHSQGVCATPCGACAFFKFCVWCFCVFWLQPGRGLANPQGCAWSGLQWRMPAGGSTLYQASQPADNSSSCCTTPSHRIHLFWLTAPALPDKPLPTVTSHHQQGSGKPTCRACLESTKLHRHPQRDPACGSIRLGPQACSPLRCTPGARTRPRHAAPPRAQPSPGPSRLLLAWRGVWTTP